MGLGRHIFLGQFGIAGPWAWILDPEMLDYGPRFPEIPAQKHTKFGAIYIILDLCVERLRILDSSDMYHFAVWVCYVWTCLLNPKSLGLKHKGPK